MPEPKSVPFVDWVYGNPGSIAPKAEISGMTDISLTELFGHAIGALSLSDAIPNQTIRGTTICYACTNDRCHLVKVDNITCVCCNAGHVI